MKVPIDYLILIFLSGVIFVPMRGWEYYGKFAIGVAGCWVILEIARKVLREIQKEEES